MLIPETKVVLFTAASQLPHVLIKEKNPENTIFENTYKCIKNLSEKKI